MRQLAIDTRGGLAQIECRLHFAMAEDLAGLSSFQQWWFPELGVARDEWFDAIASRPEWRLLNGLTPLAFGFDTDDVC